MRRSAGVLHAAHGLADGAVLPAVFIHQSDVRRRRTAKMAVVKNKRLVNGEAASGPGGARRPT